MFIRCDIRPHEVDLANVTLEEVVELSYDRGQQCDLDGIEMSDDEANAWTRLMAAKREAP